ncbi:hypothetical protein ONE63_007874 [Megalurothrips usitatus]|uniref:RRM domain-containing protein n=1 Tax=Megalurothrips usitatus TaxID=439358 RepID=A0AAV7XTY4_9NEOP|nr:hypothetical protein ONE63_007874 [Megalurothrips usitatus]
MNPPTTEEVWRALEARLGANLGGYKLIQVNGQRKLFDPTVRDAFNPPEGSEVFVGRLPRDLYEDELLPHILRVGPIFEMRFMMNFSGTNRGFAFVTFFNRRTAQKAVKLLDNLEIRSGQCIGVMPSVNNRRLYITGLCGPDSHSMHILQQCTEDLETCKFHTIRTRTGVDLRCAIVWYASHRAAAMARRRLIPLKHELFGSGVTIDWAVPYQH